jgi:hypothetical protein
VVVGSASDQPSIAVGPSGVAGIPGSVWITAENGNGSKYDVEAAAAPVLGFDSVGDFGAPVPMPGSGLGNVGSIAIGPDGQVMVDYQTDINSPGPDIIGVRVNLDPDGLGPSGFSPASIATSTNFGGYATISTAVRLTTPTARAITRMAPAAWTFTPPKSRWPAARPTSRMQRSTASPTRPD